MYRFLLVALLVTLFTSCAEVAKQVGEEIKRSEAVADSLADINGEEEPEETNVADGYKMLKRIKEGNDSLFQVAMYYKSGQKRLELWYRWRKLDGVTTYYHKNGKVFYKVLFKDGFIQTVLEGQDTLGNALDCGDLKEGDGHLKEYSPLTNKLISDEIYINGKRNGDFKRYYRTGEMKEKGLFKNDRPEGEFLVYFKNGKTKERAFFADGSITGEHHVYYHSEKIKLYEKWQDKKMMKHLEYDKRGHMTQEISMNGDNDITEMRYDYSPDGKMRSRCRLHNGMKNGIFEYYGENYLRSKEIWHNDTLLKELAWYSNGQLKSIAVYRDNERDSIYTEYYSTGKLRLQQEYKKGLQDGIYISYFDNGNKYVEGNYKDGKGVGKFKHYHKDGSYNGYYTVRDKEAPKSQE